MDYIENQYDFYLIEMINKSIDTGNIDFIKIALILNSPYSNAIKKIANDVIYQLLLEKVDDMTIL